MATATARRQTSRNYIADGRLDIATVQTMLDECRASGWRRLRLALVDVSPQGAREVLEQMGSGTVVEGKTFTNRRLNGPTATRYGRDMREGRYEVNGETIKISRSGLLIDGQHRLKSVVSEGQSVQMVLVVGVEDDAFKTIDTGRRRTFQDTLQSENVPYAKETAGAARFLWRYLYKTITSTNEHPSNLELDILLTNHPGLHESVQKVGWCKRRLTLPHGAMAFCHYVFKSSSKYPERVDEFFDSLDRHFSAGGQPFMHNPVIDVFKAEVLYAATKGLKFPQHHYIAFVLLTWNHWVEGKPLKQKALEYSPDVIKQVPAPVQNANGIPFPFARLI